MNGRVLGSLTWSTVVIVRFAMHQAISHVTDVQVVAIARKVRSEDAEDAIAGRWKKSCAVAVSESCLSSQPTEMSYRV